MNRIAVALFRRRAQADPIQQRLAQAGITAEIHDELHLEKLWFVSKKRAGARLEVAAEHSPQAEKLLREWDAAEGALRDAIRCPECKSLHVEYPQVAHHSLMTNLALGLSAELGLVEKDYYCADCHYTWPKEDAPPHRARPHSAPYYFIEDVHKSPVSKRATEPMP
jgi:hypothetical protein